MSRVLMCRPEHYQIVYEINPWMSRARAADGAAALRQWEALRDVLVDQLGARVELVTPRAGLPDMVFTANAGLVDGKRVLLSRFLHPERQGESPAFGEWFAGAGWEVLELPEECPFEGEGDALWVGDTLFAGYYFRSAARAQAHLSDVLDARVLSLQLVDPTYYHLDTCFCPLDRETAAWYPPAFDDYAQSVIRREVPRLVEVDPDEARRFACNAVVLERRVALNAGCQRFTRRLEDLGFRCFPTELGEFIKAGGSAKCLTLHLDGSPTRVLPDRNTLATPVRPTAG